METGFALPACGGKSLARKLKTKLGTACGRNPVFQKFPEKNELDNEKLHRSLGEEWRVNGKQSLRVKDPGGCRNCTEKKAVVPVEGNM